MREQLRATQAGTTPRAAVRRETPPLTGMAALQQRAGNAAVTRWVQREAGGLNEHYATRPTEHPEWGPYQEPRSGDFRCFTSSAPGCAGRWRPPSRWCRGRRRGRGRRGG
nr:hypothetical protein StreXyl84_68550 [Streptomyces sp. Xyl84]